MFLEQLGLVSIERLRQRQNTCGFCTHFCGSGSVTTEVNGDQIFSGNAPTNANAQWKQTFIRVLFCSFCVKCSKLQINNIHNK